MTTILNINDIKNLEFLTVFLNMFGAQIKNYMIENNFISGLIHWEDDDSDDEPIEFKWFLSNNQIILNDSIKILGYISTHKLHRNNKIIISELELQKIVKDCVGNVSNISDIIDFIFDQEVLLFEEGSNTHSFFLHM